MKTFSTKSAIFVQRKGIAWRLILLADEKNSVREGLLEVRIRRT